MVPLREISVGNTLLSPDTGKPVRVDLNHLKCIRDGLLFNGKEYEPIILCPDILKNCSFEPRGNKGIAWHLKYGLNEFVFYISDGYICYQTQGSGFTLNFNGRIKHLHQLQNVYLWIIGEELNYNYE